MRKISKIRLTVCLILACFAVGCIVFAGMGVKANASGTFEMKSGASVKVGTDNGLRFTAVLPASEYENGATYGMLIAPEDYVRTNDLTVENVFGENAVYDYAVRNEQGEFVYFGTKTRIINVTYDTLPTDENGDYLIKGSILSLKDNNIARNFVGRAYKRTGTEGSYVYEMANYTGGNVGNNARSMFAVAKAAINSDRESAATKAVLETEYIDKSYTLATLTEGDDYVKFFSKSSSENGSVIRDLTETTDVPEGYDKAYSMNAQYGDAYTLFAGVNLEEYIRLKFMIKGTYTAPGIGYFDNTGWKEIKCKKNSDGVWSLSYNGTEVPLQQKMTLSGSICITDLYGVKEDASAKYYRVTYKNENNEILCYKSIKSGNSAALTPDDKDLGDGYTLTYDNVKWLDSIGGSEVDLSSVTKDMTVYFGGEKITYIKVEKYSDASGYKRIVDLNKYIIADENGNIEFKIRLNGTNGSSFIIYEKTTWTDSEFGQWIDGNEWWTVKGNAVAKSVTTYKPNGEVAASKVFNDYNAETMSIFLNCDVDLAAVSGKKKLEITNVAVLNKYAPSTTSQNEDDRVYKYAVEELIGLYSELTGTTLEVNYVNSASELDANKKYFVLGSALAEENGLSQDRLTTDTGYIVKKKSGSVYLYGKTGYGTLNALYGAFSQAFGLEFYTDTVYTYDSGEFGYDKIEDTVFNPSIDYNWASGEMEYIPSGEGNPNFNYQHRLGYVNSWQIIGGGYHNFFEVLPKETYKAAHPDWYTTATNPGGESFDTLSLAYGLEAADNDVMATAVADYVYDYITEQKNNHVEKSMFVFGQPDNWGWSNSSYSQAIKNKYGAYSAEYILFMNKVAKILDEKYTLGRRLQLTLLAYNATLETPTYSDDLKFYNGDEVYMGVIFAPIESNLYLRLDSPANGYSEHNESNDGYAEIYGKTNQYYYNQLLSWKRFLNGGELSVFYYSAHYDNYFVPLDSVTNMGQKYKFFADNGVKHIYNLGQAGDDVHTDWYALKTYMGKKYAENASRTDADGLILNFCKAYYGAAGEIMYELYKAEVAQYKVASDYWINQTGADPTGGHLIRGYLFNRNCWGGNSNLLLGWYGKIENALATVESGSVYYNRVKIEGLNIRYLLAGVFGNTAKGSMSDISADAKSLGIDIFAEGSAYTSDGKYGQSGKIEDLK